VGGEELALDAIGFERMPADVEAEDLLLACKALGLGHRRHVGERARTGGCPGRAVGHAEQRDLAHRLLLLLERRFLHRGVERAPVLRAVAAKAVKRAGGDQRLEDSLVAGAKVYPIREVEEGREGLLVPCGEDRVDCAAANVADGAEPEADPLVREHGELVVRLVHVGRQHLDAELARLVDELHHRVGVADGRRQDGRHEIGGEVRLEPRRVEGDDRVRDRVRLVEAVAAEGLDLPRELLDDAPVVAARDGLLDELAQLRLDELRVLLAHRLAQHVGFGERDAGQRLRDAHHLFLVGDDAIRRFEDRLQLGERVAHRLLAAFAALVDLVHPGVERAGPHERVAGHEVVEPVAAHGAQHVRRERRLELEHAGGAARAQHLIGGRIGEIDCVQVGTHAGAALDVVERVADHRQRGEAEEVHLEHAGMLETVHVVLGDDDRLVSAGARALAVHREDRDVVIERSRRDDDARRVHAGMAREPFERNGVVEQGVVAVVGGVELPDLRHLLDRVLHGEREGRAVGNQLRQRVGLRGREAECAPDVLDGRARLHRPEGDDLADRLLAVLLAYVLDHLAAPLEAEIDVDVGHRDAFRIQEALEQQVILERADVGDLQRVRDE